MTHCTVGVIGLVIDSAFSDNYTVNFLEALNVEQHTFSEPNIIPESDMFTLQKTAPVDFVPYSYVDSTGVNFLYDLFSGLNVYIVVKYLNIFPDAEMMSINSNVAAPPPVSKSCRK